MTTLELAQKIALAVYSSDMQGDSLSNINIGTMAVLRVLHENDSWFVRNPTGDEWHEEQEERYEMVQPGLFK